MGKKKQRQETLLNYIKKQEFITTKDLEKVIGCSYPTLCRDLSELENNKEIIRSHGCVRYLEKKTSKIQQQIGANTDYYMYQARLMMNTEEKKAIGKIAASLVRPNDSLFVTHGTTTTQFTKSIEKNQILTIITDGLDIINSLSTHHNIKLYSTGGVMNYSSMQIEHHPFLSSDVQKININKLIMGIGGLSLTHGITFYDFISFKFIEQILDQINEIIVLADHTKLDTVALANFIPIHKITTLVTDWNADETFLSELRALGIQCYVASPRECEDISTQINSPW